MQSVMVHLKGCMSLVGKCMFLLAVFALVSGCQKAGPPVTQDDIRLAQEMKTWFEATDYKASGFATLDEALDKIYQDDGYTLSLYHELKTVLNQGNPSRTAYDDVLKRCQEWFEMIDYQRSGYNSLEKAIKDIYRDDGMTLDLYRRLARRNAKSG